MIVDGNDPLDVYATVHSAIRHARKGEGPALVECKTYRYLAHTSDDDDRTYRTPQEVEMWRKKDPLQRMKQYIIEQRLLSEQREDEIEAELRERRRHEVTSRRLGDMVLVRLRRMDMVAYLRFASVYRQYTDVDQFRTELVRLAGSGMGNGR